MAPEPLRPGNYSIRYGAARRNERRPAAPMRVSPLLPQATDDHHGSPNASSSNS